MKRQYLLLLCACFYFFSCGPSIKGVMVDQMTKDGFRSESGEVFKLPNYGSKDATVFYLVRHAEKELEGDNPGLTEAGKKRADRLAEILREVSLEKIYSTNYKRTIATVRPTARQQNLEISSYDHRQHDQLIESLPREIGNHYLIVGHSNSIPNLLNLFKGKEVYPDIDESVYDNFYVLVIDGQQKVKVHELKY